MPEKKRAARRPRRPAPRAPRFAPFEGLRFYCQRKMEENPEFFQHLANSRVELWKAIRSFIDWRIESLERRRERTGRKGVTRVRISE